MPLSVTQSLTALAVVVVALILLVTFFRPSLTLQRGGKILAFLALFVFPVVVTWTGLSEHLELSKSTRFCLSCHVMEPYGESLWIDDPAYLPASHFQNKRTPPERACYTCHTSYTMYGDLQAKLRGVAHVYVYYLGEPPDRLSLYEPYRNRECLHCHGGARRFEELEEHVDVREELETEELRCLDCHDQTHAVDRLHELDRWEGNRR